MLEIVLNLSTVACSILATVSTSESWLPLPKEMRIEPAASREKTPIASRTWEGSGSPVVQADPVDCSQTLAP
jgi:hypothetical protein